MSYYNSGVPETRNSEPQPPYNATNFNAANPTVFNKLKTYAGTQPNYPLPPGTDASLIYRNTANVTYFNYINQATLAIKSQANNAPYPQFKTEGERLKYRQGLLTTAARTQISGNNPALPMGVPLYTNYQIINNTTV